MNSDSTVRVHSYMIKLLERVKVSLRGWVLWHVTWRENTFSGSAATNCLSSNEICR